MRSSATLVATRKCEHSLSAQSHSSIMTRYPWSTILVDREQGNDEAKRIDIFTNAMGNCSQNGSATTMYRALYEKRRMICRKSNLAKQKCRLRRLAWVPGRWVAGNGNPVGVHRMTRNPLRR